jgi:hypothetical protein
MRRREFILAGAGSAACDAISRYRRREGHLRRKDQKTYGCRIRPATPVDSDDLRGGREIPSSCAAGDVDRCLESPPGAVRR